MTYNQRSIVLVAEDSIYINYVYRALTDADGYNTAVVNRKLLRLRDVARMIEYSDQCRFDRVGYIELEINFSVILI